MRQTSGDSVGTLEFRGVKAGWENNAIVVATCSRKHGTNLDGEDRIFAQGDDEMTFSRDNQIFTRRQLMQCNTYGKERPYTVLRYSIRTGKGEYRFDDFLSKICKESFAEWSNGSSKESSMIRRKI